jgi:hypothetical protein
MRMADGDAGLAAMPGEARRGMEQQRTTGNGFGMLAGVGQAHEQAPPVIGQRRDAGHEAAAFNILGGETAPAPMVLELVERIFRVGAVAVHLGGGEDFARERGHQHRVFVNDRVVGEFGEAQTQLFGIAPLDHGEIGFDLAAQHDGPARAAPALQTQAGLGPLPTLAGFAPVGPAHQAFDGFLDPWGHPQLEQIGDALLLGPRHVGLRAPVAVAANDARPVRTRQPREELPQPGRAVLGGRSIAVLHLHIQDQAQTGKEIRVVGVRGAARLVRVIAFDRPFLMSIERLDRDVGIENPRLAQ